MKTGTRLKPIFVLALIVLQTFLFIPISCQKTGPVETPLRVLFIGNSYTSANSLPTIFENIATSSGHAAPLVESVTPGGYTFQNHLADANTRSMISKRIWDVVVMQEQSEVPAVAQTSPYVKKSFIDSFDGLVGLVKESSPQARVILFETWARNADLWTSGAINMTQYGEKANDMTLRLKEGYEEAAQSIIIQGQSPVEIARVGELWETNYLINPQLRLHDTDGSHPNYAGSYLAALDIFGVIYGNVPNHINFHGTLDAKEANKLIDTVVSFRKANNG